MDLLGPGLEGADDALHGLVEHETDHLLQERRTKLEIDEEIDLAGPFGQVGETPVVVEMAKGAVDVFDVDRQPVRVEPDAGAEALAEHLEGDDEIGLHQLAPLLERHPAADPRRRHPGQELGIGGDIGDEIVDLACAPGKLAFFAVSRHGIFVERSPPHAAPGVKLQVGRHKEGLPGPPAHLRAGPGKGRRGMQCEDRAPRAQRGDTMTQEDETGQAQTNGAADADQPDHGAYIVEPMISAKAIAARVEALAKEIERTFADTELLVVVGLLRGSFIFIADLVRELRLPVEVDFIEASSYGNAMESTREVRILKDLRAPIEGRDVLLVEDIVDTGHTLSQVVKMLRARKPRRLATIALLDKPSRREVEIRADWIGFEIPDEFVVGYGIDYAQRNRNLPHIGKVVFRERGTDTAGDGAGP